MASTRFGKCSGASVAAVVLVVALLAGVFAPGIQAQIAQLKVENKLPDNAVRFTIANSSLPGASGLTFVIAARGSETRTLQVQQSASPVFTFDVLVWDPEHPESEIVKGSYSSTGNLASRITSADGLRVVIVGECENAASNPGLRVKAYPTLPIPSPLDNIATFDECLPQNA